MNVSGSSLSTLLDSALHAETTRNEMGVALLKKAQDVTRQQGEAMVQVIEQAGDVKDSGRLDVYA